MAQIPAKDFISTTADNIKSYMHRTPVMHSKSLNKLSGCDLYFKCENFQKTGSFKIRGAMNAILKLSTDERRKGVVTHSSGNFAQAVAYAAASIGIKAQIVMPDNVVASKRDAVLGYGAEIIYSGNQPLDREKKCDEVIKQTGAVFIHPSNDINVISGHSSCAVELIQDAEDLDYVFVPVGGGGLASGISIGFHHFSPNTKVIGGEPKNADDAYQSLQAGRIIPQTNPNTIADGLRTSLGDVTFPIIKELLSEIVTVSEDEIINAMRLIWERMKIVAEPSGAVSFAAALKKSPELKNKKIGIIISGGNADLTKLPF
jgi:threonine dehydratase